MSSLVVDAVLFDSDGTLIDSTAAVERVWRSWLAAHGLPLTTPAGHGIPTAANVERLLGPDAAPGALAELDALELADTDGLALLPRAIASLTALDDGTSAIVTSCSRQLMAARAGATGLPVPRVLVTSDDVAQGKPAPDPYLLAAELLGVNPARCLVVEDAPAGVTSGRAAGCTVLGLGTTYPAETLNADLIAGSLADVTFEPTHDGRVRVTIAPDAC